MNRPEKIEYNPYFQPYIDLVEQGDFMQLLRANTELVSAFFQAIPIEKQLFQYAPTKWTIKEILMHLIDVERVFAYRALVCLRGDHATPLHSMDEHLYASTSHANEKGMQELIDEFLLVRKNAEFLFSNASETECAFLGNAITHHFSARAIGYIMIGHALHHINVIQERYL